MKASLNWICDYLEQPLDRQTVADTLSRIGFPVEAMEPVPDSDDWMLEVEITSNRPDCLCHLGLARELVAAGMGDIRRPRLDGSPDDQGASIASEAGLEVLDLNACPHYIARVIKGVRIGPSPDWMVRRLTAVGLRSINNVVDITNFVLLECGQPLHAFDLAHLAERRIVVRRAHADEAFTAIDGTKHRLKPSMLVIADAKRAVALAGVMGGLDSEVSEKTTEVLLESARFDPLIVRRAARGTKLSSDSSFRFERGVDPAGVDWASRRACALFAQLAGGTILPGKLEAGSGEAEPKRISLRTRRCAQVIGMQLSDAQVTEHLRRLELNPLLQPTSGNPDSVLECQIPSHRLDLDREIDLVEEVARLHGLDHLEVDASVSLQIRPPQPRIAALRCLGDVLTAQGFFEIVSPSFLPTSQARAFFDEDMEPVAVQADRRKADPTLRPSLWPSLLACRKLNQDVGNSDVRLYETAASWHRDGQGIQEAHTLALLADCDQPQTAWREMRGVLDELLVQLQGESNVQLDALEHPEFDVSASLSHGGKVRGRMGIPGPRLLKRFDLKQPVILAQFDLDWLLAGYPPSAAVGQLARFPGIERDLSLVVSEDTPWSAIERAVWAIQPALMEKLAFLVTYRGKPIPTGHKSVSFRMTFRDPSRTLRHEEVDPQIQAIVEHLGRSLDAQLRA
ncbi:MAG: phenylalanine--tRNA ligase subunit beta [Phycisphaeraceae bacterium]|nr:phenylalanine--tRNA ligase subunit beta [Phycisphaeraceae bacterium]